MSTSVINNTPHYVLQNAKYRATIDAVDTIYSDIIMAIVHYKSDITPDNKILFGDFNKGGAA